MMGNKNNGDFVFFLKAGALEEGVKLMFNNMSD